MTYTESRSVHAARRRQAARGPSGSLLVASQREPLGESLLLVGESRRRALDLKKLNNGFADELSQWLPVMALLSSARFLQTSPLSWCRCARHGEGRKVVMHVRCCGLKNIQHGMPNRSMAPIPDCDGKRYCRARSHQPPQAAVPRPDRPGRRDDDQNDPRRPDVAHSAGKQDASRLPRPLHAPRRPDVPRRTRKRVLCHPRAARMQSDVGCYKQEVVDIMPQKA